MTQQPHSHHSWVKQKYVYTELSKTRKKPQKPSNWFDEYTAAYPRNGILLTGKKNELLAHIITGMNLNTFAKGYKRSDPI